MKSLDTMLPLVMPLAEALALALSVRQQTGYRNSGHVIFEDRILRLRLSSDQGEASIDIASQQDPDNWFDLGLLYALDRGLPLDEPQPLEALVAYGIEAAPRLRADFGAGFAETRVRLGDAERARYALMFPEAPLPG